MNRYCNILIVLIGSAASALVPVQLSYGAGSTSASFTETYSDGEPHEASAGPSPLPVASITGDTGSSIYTIDAEFDITNSTTLRTTASIILSTNAGDEVLWSRVDGQARAEASLVAFGFVQGVPDGATGTLQFNWAVSGNTRLLFEDPSNVDVDVFSALTTLQTTIPKAGGMPLNELHSHPGGDDLLEVTLTGTQTVFTVPYTAGTQVPVFFDLFSQVDLEVRNTSDGSFHAEGMAQFGNSAVLDSVLVLDQQGREITHATFEMTVVPEPSSFVLVGLAVVAVAVGRGVVQARRKART